MEYKKGRLFKESNTDYINVEDTLDLIKKGIIISIRGCGDFKHRAFYLDSSYDWIIREDDEGALCLIPIEKGE